MSHRIGTPPLWLTFRGAAPSLGIAWLAWTAASVGFARATQGPFIEALGVVPLLVIGFVAARHLPSPLEALKRYHLDDGEITSMGPFRRVRRIAWADVDSLTQSRHALLVRANGSRSFLPLQALRLAGGWGPVLVRIVPVVASRLWMRLERGRLTLRPQIEPPLGATILWTWIPALLACAAATDARGAAIACGAIAGERVVCWLVARSHAVTLDPRGVVVRSRRGPRFLPWTEVLATATQTGLELGAPGRDPEVVPTSLRDYWAAAPVIELRAQLGPDCPSDVCFRAHVDGGALAVVGEIEAPTH